MRRQIARVLLTGILTTTAIAPVKAAENGDDGARLSSSTFAGLKLRGIGPALMSGRIADIAIHPERRSTWYVAAGSGGVWKTTNAGTTWTPVFDDQPSYSIRCVTLDRRLQGAAAELETAGKRVDYLEKAVFETPAAPTDLLPRLQAAAREIADLEIALTGDPIRGQLREPSAPSILGRVRSIVFGHWNSRSGPTATHHREFEIATEAYARLAPRLRDLIEGELPEIERALEQAGAPWTPGRRPVP